MDNIKILTTTGWVSYVGYNNLTKEHKILYFDHQRHVKETQNYSINKVKNDLPLIVFNKKKQLISTTELNEDYTKPISLIFNKPGLSISNNKLREEALRHSGISLKIRKSVSRKLIRKITKDQALFFLNNLVRFDGWIDRDYHWIFRQNSDLYYQYQELALIAGLNSIILFDKCPLFAYNTLQYRPVTKDEKLNFYSITINEPDVFGYILNKDGQVKYIGCEQ